MTFWAWKAGLMVSEWRLWWWCKLMEKSGGFVVASGWRTCRFWCFAKALEVVEAGVGWDLTSGG